MPTYLLIDLSYAIFYRFFATKMWYSLKYPEEKEDFHSYNWIENPVFVEMFEKKFFDSFYYFIQKHKISHENIIMVRDCPRSNIWRNQHINKYKSNRPQFEGGEFFKLVYNKILPSLLNDNKIKCVLKYDELEADDVIALTKKYLQDKYKDCKIVIITSDHDLLQLIDENTTLYSLKKKCLNDKSTGNRFTDLHLKILCGDKSDNIEGCIPKCGEKTAMKFIKDRKKLGEKLMSDSEIMNKYIENRLIIDFDNIPHYLQYQCTEYINDFNL